MTLLYTLFGKLGVCNNLADQGKAVFNKNEYGFQLIAQKDGQNVHETSWSYHKLIKTKRTKTINLRKVSSNFSGIDMDVDKDEDTAQMPENGEEVQDFSPQYHQ